MSPSYALSPRLGRGAGIVARRVGEPCKRAFVAYRSKKPYKAKETIRSFNKL